jgi:hypothetical protein
MTNLILFQLIIGCIWLLTEYICYGYLNNLKKIDKNSIFYIVFFFDYITFLLLIFSILLGNFGAILIILSFFTILISITKLLPYFYFIYLFFVKGFDKVFIISIILMLVIDGAFLMLIIKFREYWNFSFFWIMYLTKISISFFLTFKFQIKQFYNKIKVNRKLTHLIIVFLIVFGGYNIGKKFGYYEIKNNVDFHNTASFALKNYYINIEVLNKINNNNISGAIELTKNAMETNKKIINICLKLDDCKLYIEYKLHENTSEFINDIKNN